MLTSVARYALARGVPGLINFAALALFTRLLDEQQYGQYALIFAAVALGNALLLQWLSHGLLRLAAPYAGRRQIFLATVLRLFVPLYLLTSVVLVVGVGLTAGWHDGRLMSAGVALLLAQGWHDLNLNLATADQRPGLYGGLSTLRAGASLLFGGLAAWAGLGATGVAGGVAVGGLVSGLYAWFLSWTRSLRVPGDGALRRELFRYGIPLAGAFVLAYVISAADRFMLAEFISPAAAGVYAPAYDLVLQAMGVLMMVVNLVGFPKAVVAVESGDPATRDRQFREHATLLWAVALPAAAGIATLAPSVSQILGPRFAPAARQLLPLLAVAQLLAGIKAFYFDLSFQLGRATRLQLLTVAAGAAVNIVLNVWWIPRYGIMGAAYATLAAYLVALALSWGLGRNVLPLPTPWAALARITVATTGMCLVLLFVRGTGGPLALVAQVTLGATVYTVLLLLFAGGNRRRMLA